MAPDRRFHQPDGPPERWAASFAAIFRPGRGLFPFRRTRRLSGKSPAPNDFRPSPRSRFAAALPPSWRAGTEFLKYSGPSTYRGPAPIPPFAATPSASLQHCGRKFGRGGMGEGLPRAGSCRRPSNEKRSCDQNWVRRRLQQHRGRFSTAFPPRSRQILASPRSPHNIARLPRRRHPNRRRFALIW